MPDQLINYDGRQSETAAAVQRGVRRLLYGLDLVSLPEFSLKSGRRADVIAMDAKNAFWIIEIKSSLEDFRADSKWPDYWEYCDQLYFAVPPCLDNKFVPASTGLIIADAWGADIIRHPPQPRRLKPARRKSLTQHFARTAARRLQRIEDPGLTTAQPG